MPVATRSREVVFAWLVRNLERLIEELEFHQVWTNQLAVWIGYQDGLGRTGQAERMNIRLRARVES